MIRWARTRRRRDFRARIEGSELAWTQALSAARVEEESGDSIVAEKLDVQTGPKWTLTYFGAVQTVTHRGQSGEMAASG